MSLFTSACTGIVLATFNIKQFLDDPLKENHQFTVPCVRKQIHRDCFHWSEWDAFYSIGLPLTQAFVEEKSRIIVQSYATVF